MSDARTESSWFYRWWPSLAVGFGGVAIIAAVCGFISAHMQNQDAAIALSFAMGCVMGIPVGQVAYLVWESRNPW